MNKLKSFIYGCIMLLMLFPLLTVLVFAFRLIVIRRVKDIKQSRKVHTELEKLLYAVKKACNIFIVRAVRRFHYRSLNWVEGLK